jgi:hypothetical protein
MGIKYRQPMTVRVLDIYERFGSYKYGTQVLGNFV